LIYWGKLSLLTITSSLLLQDYEGKVL
jgi:hypothetical protein